MTEITHTIAHALLQDAADGNLASSDRSALDAHLAACAECNQYAQQLSDLETSLQQTLHAKWDNFRPEIDLQGIRNPSPLKLLWTSLFQQTQVLGKASILAALLVGYLVLTNVIGIRVPLGDNTTPTILPTPSQSLSIIGIQVPPENNTTPTILPTPNESLFIADISPTPSTLTTLNQGTPACQTIKYVVKENDTLEYIALRHGITKELILEYNPDDLSLAANTVFLNMELVIPLCKGTPVYTASLPGSTLTTTPIYRTIFPEINE